MKNRCGKCNYWRRDWHQELGSWGVCELQSPDVTKVEGSRGMIVKNHFTRDIFGCPAFESNEGGQG